MRRLERSRIEEEFMRTASKPFATATGSAVAVFALLLVFLTVPFGAARADNTCAYNFYSGKGSAYWTFCVTQNGNIPSIVMPVGIQLIGPYSEGYGICDEGSQNYTDYGVSDTGNWGPSTLVSQTTTSVKITRTTSDGNWTLTQTITQNAHTPSITVVMALTNNQSTNQTATLLRFVEAQPPNSPNNSLSTLGYYGAVTWALQSQEPDYGLMLTNTGFPMQFLEIAPIVQTVVTGPDACAPFANNAGEIWGSALGENLGTLEIVYQGYVKAHKTNTVTLTYLGL
jgi:hypothetical protein